MLKVGITGGIGSGKSMVCRVFSTLGIPIFYADDAARYVMEHDIEIIQNIKALFGSEAYIGATLNRTHIAAIVFQNKGKLAQLNALTHPATIRYGQEWMQQQQAPYIIKEAAIFFETGSDKDMDVMLGVFAPVDLRINRTLHREGMNTEKIKERIALQMDEVEKMKRCDYVITNDEVQAVLPQVLKLHAELLKRVSKN